MKHDGGKRLKLTRFEKARIIGARSLQISMGAPILIKRDKGNKMNNGAENISDPILIAIEELEKGTIPISVIRSMPAKKVLDD